MSRRNQTFLAGLDRMLGLLARMQPGRGLGAEQELAAELGLSRTTVRAILAHLSETGLIAWEGRDKRLLRAPGPQDRPEASPDPAESFPGQFLGWILEGDVPPGTALNESELARRFGVPVSAVRDFLIRFAPMGLIEKAPNRHWRLKGFTRAFAAEMFDMRELIEMQAVRALAAAPDLARVAALAEAGRPWCWPMAGPGRRRAGTGCSRCWPGNSPCISTTCRATAAPRCGRDRRPGSAGRAWSSPR